MPKRILVVDDLQYLREVQVMLLNEAGYTATAIGTASEALDRLTEISPDLILARLREAPQWKALPVILTTGRLIDDVARDTDCDILAKPFTESALLDYVRRVIGEA